MAPALFTFCYNVEMSFGQSARPLSTIEFDFKDIERIVLATRLITIIIEITVIIMKLNWCNQFGIGPLYRRFTAAAKLCLEPFVYRWPNDQFIVRNVH